jgi:hypothetical protein
LCFFWLVETLKLFTARRKMVAQIMHVKPQHMKATAIPGKVGVRGAVLLRAKTFFL